MAKRARKVKAPARVLEYVAVAFTTSEEEAKNYRVLLRNDNIPANVKEQVQNEDTGAGFAVMVPEEFADEAYVIVESNDSYDDFYDINFEDEDVSFDDDIFNDNY